MRALKKATETATADSASTAPIGSATLLVAPRDDLKRALKRLLAVADRRSTMPMLANVLIRASGTGLVLAATDLYVTMVTESPAWHPCPGLAPGGTTVNAKALSDLVASLPAGDVRITRDGVHATVSAGAVTSSIPTMHERDFPKVPDTSAVSWSEVPAAELSGLFDKCLPFVCKDETRFHLNGVLFQSDGTTAVTVATDGHRLAKCQTALLDTPKIPSAGVIVPSKGAAQLVKLLGSKARGECEIAVVAPYLHVRYQGTTLSVKCIDAMFPPYEQVIPKNHGKLATVDRKALISALDRAKLTCSETRGAKLTIGDGKLVITSDNPDTGTLSESMAATGVAAESDKASHIGMNPRYLLDALGEIDDKLVTIALGDELAPFLVRGTEHACSYPVVGSPFLVVIMPMRM